MIESVEQTAGDSFLVSLQVPHVDWNPLIWFNCHDEQDRCVVVDAWP